MRISGFPAAFFDRCKFLKVSMLALALSANPTSAQDHLDNGAERLGSVAQLSAIDVTECFKDSAAVASVNPCQVGRRQYEDNFQLLLNVMHWLSRDL